MFHRLFLVLFLATAVSDAQAQRSGPREIPTGRGFPAEEEEIRKIRSLIDKKDPDGESRLREHGWRLFGLVMEDVKWGWGYWPRWYSWCTSYEVFQTSAPCREKRDLTGRQQGLHFKFPDGSPGRDLQAVISDVYLNPKMVEYLEKHRLRKARAGVTARLENKEVAIPVPDRDVMAVKAHWQLVGCPQVEGPAPSITVWSGTQDTNNGVLDTAKFITYYIDPRSMNCFGCKPHAGAKIPDHVNPSRIRKLNDFFWYPARRDGEAHVGAAVELLERGRFLINTGLHIMTREQDDWVFATYWMNPSGDGRYADGRDRVRTRKAHSYWMDVTLSSSPEMMNPYIEGRVKDGPHSNCLHCHAQASVSWSDSAKRPVLSIPPFGVGDKPKPTGTLFTQFLWTIAAQASRETSP